MNIDFEKGGGLVPAIVQDADTLQVLMLGYMNADAVEATRDSGLVTFYSRSRQSLWQKGETSGNTLALVDMQIDCDADTVLVRAKPAEGSELQVQSSRAFNISYLRQGYDTDNSGTCLRQNYATG